MELRDGQIKMKAQEQNKITIFLEEYKLNSHSKNQVFHKTQPSNKLLKTLEQKFLREEQEELQELAKNSKLQMTITQNL